VGCGAYFRGPGATDLLVVGFAPRQEWGTDGQGDSTHSFYRSHRGSNPGILSDDAKVFILYERRDCLLSWNFRRCLEDDAWILNKIL
jgi:hypothetical protein